MNIQILQEFLDTQSKLIEGGFRFSVIHNPDAKHLSIISATRPDLIKHKFPEFNIYLSDRHAQQKIVEKVFIYA